MTTIDEESGMATDFDGLVAVVTGGASGIGLATARLLAQRGRLFFTHDPIVAMGRVARDGKGKYGIVDECRDVRDLTT